MEIAVAADLAVDLATKDDLQEHHRRLESIFPRQPEGRYYMVDGSGRTTAAFTGSGPIALAFTPSAPPAGRRWYLQWVAVFVATLNVNAAVANLLAALMIGRAPVGPDGTFASGLSVTSYEDVVLPGLVVPNGTNIPDKTMVKSQQQLYVLLSGAGLAASTTYIARVGLIDAPDVDDSLYW